MNFNETISNGYMIPTSVAVGSGEATDIRCVCDTVEDFKTFLDTTGMELRYEGLVTYEKVNKLLKVYKGNDTWQTVGEGGGSVDTSSFITLTQLSQQLNSYYTKYETDEAMNDKANKVHTHNEYLTELPTHTHSEYLTEHQDISHKADKENTYTKSQTDNKISEEIAKAQLGGSGSGNIDLSDYYTKEEVNDKLGNKDYKYLTQSEYDLLSNEEKNNESITYFITDAKEDVFTLSLDGNKLSLLKNGISISSVVIPTSSNEGSETPGETPNPDEGDNTPEETPNPDEGSGDVIEYTNLIFNDDTFENPLTSNAPAKSTYFYTSATTSREVVSGVLRLFSNTGDQNYGILIRCGYGDNKVYYHQFKVKSDVGLVAGSPQGAVLNTNKAVDDWTLVSYICTDTSAYSHSMKLYSTDGGKLGGSVYMKEPMRICLTDIFGAGNEPTDVTECDKMFAKFVPGQRGY